MIFSMIFFFRFFFFQFFSFCIFFNSFVRIFFTFYGLFLNYFFLEHMETSDFRVRSKSLSYNITLTVRNFHFKNLRVITHNTRSLTRQFRVSLNFFFYCVVSEVKSLVYFAGQTRSSLNLYM